MITNKTKWLLVGWLLAGLTATQTLREKSATACARWVNRRVAIRTISLVLILLITGCLDRSVNYQGVRYDTLEEAIAAIRLDDAAMWAKINRRDHPLVSPALFFRPSRDYLFDWFERNKHYPRCVLYFCRGTREINWEIELDAIHLNLNHFSTATAIEYSNIFESVSIETYDDPGDIPHGDPIRFMIVIGPTSEGLSWSLWAPGSSTSARLPYFEKAIKPRERRMNNWIDKLELKSLKEMALVYHAQGRSAEAAKMEARAKAIRAKSE